MKVGLLLEGGAMRGLYTVGVLDILMDNNIKVDTIIGVSAGALFGVNFKSKQRQRALRYNLKYANDKRYMGMNSLLKTGNIMNKEFCFDIVPYELDIFDFKTFEKSPEEFYAVVTNVETGKPEYIKIDDLDEKMEYLRASGSMPFVSKFVEIDGKKYLDGGTADSIPIEKMLEMGLDKIIVVLTRPIEYRKKKSNKIMPKLFYSKYPNFVNTINNRYKRYNEQVEKIIELEKQGKIFVVRPTKTVKMKRVENDTNKLQEMYDLGINDANNLIKDLKEYLNML
ncbi:MAG: patatin family protein [Clostridia bacterium]|nr:patatin family protein [Clostridia bacterium]